MVCVLAPRRLADSPAALASEKLNLKRSETAREPILATRPGASNNQFERTRELR
jgi:hypothetical protein